MIKIGYGNPGGPSVKSKFSSTNTSARTSPATTSSPHGQNLYSGNKTTSASTITPGTKTVTTTALGTKQITVIKPIVGEEKVSAIKGAGYNVVTTPALGGKSLVLGVTPVEVKPIIKTTTTPTATYDRTKGGIITSDNKFFPTTNPNWIPAGYEKPQIVNKTKTTTSLGQIAGRTESLLTPTVTPTTIIQNVQTTEQSSFAKFLDNVLGKGPTIMPNINVRPVSTTEILRGYTPPKVELPTGVQISTVPSGEGPLQTFAVNLSNVVKGPPTSVISPGTLGASMKVDILNQKINQFLIDRKNPIKYNPEQEQTLKIQREQLAAELSVQYPGVDTNKVLLDVTGKNVKQTGTVPTFELLEKGIPSNMIKNMQMLPAEEVFKVSVPSTGQIDELAKKTETYNLKIQTMQQKQAEVDKKVSEYIIKQEEVKKQIEERKGNVNVYDPVSVSQFNQWQDNIINEMDVERKKLKAEVRDSNLNIVLLEEQEGKSLGVDIEKRNVLIEQQTKDYEKLKNLEEDFLKKYPEQTTLQKIKETGLSGITYGIYGLAKEQKYKKDFEVLQEKESEYKQKYYGVDLKNISLPKFIPKDLTSQFNIDIGQVQELQMREYPKTISPIEQGYAWLRGVETPVDEPLKIIGKEIAIEAMLRGTTTTSRREYEKREVSKMAEKAMAPIERGQAEYLGEIALIAGGTAAAGEAIPWIAGKSIFGVSKVAKFAMNPVVQKIMLGGYVAGEGVNVGTGEYRIKYGTSEQQYAGVKQVSGTITRGLGVMTGVQWLKAQGGTPYKNIYKRVEPKIIEAYYNIDRKIYDMFGKQLPESTNLPWTKGLVFKEVPQIDKFGAYTRKQKWEWVPAKGQTTMGKEFVIPGESKELPLASTSGKYNVPTKKYVEAKKPTWLEGKEIVLSDGTVLKTDVGIKSIDIYGTSKPIGMGITESGKMIMQGVQPGVSEGVHSRIGFDKMGAYNLQTGEYVYFKGSDVVNTPEGLTFIKTKGGLLPSEYLTDFRTQMRYREPPFTVTYLTKQPGQSTLENFIPKTVIDLTGYKYVPKKLTTTQELALLKYTERPLDKDMTDYIVKTFSSKDIYVPPRKGLKYGTSTGPFAPENIRNFQMRMDYATGQNLNKYLINPETEYATEQGLVLVKPKTGAISSTSPEAVSNTEMFLRGTEFRPVQKINLEFIPRESTKIGVSTGVGGITGIKTVNKLSLLFPTIPILKMTQPTEIKAFQNIELQKMLNIKPFQMPEMTPLSKLEYTPVQGIKIIPVVVPKPKPVQSTSLETEQLTLTELGLTPITELSVLGAVGLPSLKPFEFPKLSGLLGFGGLPKGGEEALLKKKRIKEWVVVNPIRDLPAEFFGKMPMSKYNMPRQILTKEPPFTNFNKMYNR